MLKKNLRVIDKKLLGLVRLEKCEVRGCNFLAQAAHIKSRGAQGDDVPENLIPLCWMHHREQHICGWKLFGMRYPELRTFAQILRDRGQIYVRGKGIMPAPEEKTEESMNISVHCAHVELVDAKELRPNPRNPNKHPKKQEEADRTTGQNHKRTGMEGTGNGV